MNHDNTPMMLLFPSASGINVDQVSQQIPMGSVQLFKILALYGFSPIFGILTSRVIKSFTGSLWKKLELDGLIGVLGFLRILVLSHRFLTYQTASHDHQV
jgi:hypothetical protein